MTIKSKIFYNQGIKYFHYLISLLIFSFSTTSNSQTDSSIIDAEALINNLIKDSEFEDVTENFYDLIEDLTLSPIELNSAGINDLLRIPGLSAYYASLIINHRARFGNFFSLDELFLVEGLPIDIVNQIKPFLKLNLTNEDETSGNLNSLSALWDGIISNSQINLRSRIVNDIQDRTGFMENKYEGTKPKLYNRFLIRGNKNFNAALITEKDAGERSFNEFTAFHLALNNIGIVNLLVLGDYTIEFGQGIALWGPFAFSKSSDAIYPTKRKGKLINPYKSTMENNFFRGAAASFRISDFLFSSFYSSNYLDGNIDTASNSILSLPIDGNHRTEAEIRKRNTVKENLFGFTFEYKPISSTFNSGILFYKTKFSNPFFGKTINDLEGDNFNFISVYFDFVFNRINFFGESSTDQKSLASLLGLSISLGKTFSTIAVFRNYPASYKNIHGYGFGENSGSTKNEIGFYTGFSWKIPLGQLNFYFDQFKFPYATFSNAIPSSGYEFLFDLSSKPLSQVETNLRYKHERKELSQKIDNLKSLVTQLKQTYRGEIIYEVSKSLRLKTRVEILNYILNSFNKENGLMVFQDLRIFPLQNIQLDSRIIFFQTDSFHSAIYEFENDLAGIFTNTALYGKGVRWYLLVKFKIIKHLSISAKYSETYKPLEKVIGSGLSEIQNNVDNKISLQIDLNY